MSLKSNTPNRQKDIHHTEKEVFGRSLLEEMTVAACLLEYYLVIIASMEGEPMLKDLQYCGYA